MSKLSIVLALAVVCSSWGQDALARDENPENVLRQLASEPVQVEQDRQVVLDFLERAEVRETGQSHGLDVDRMKDGVRTLDPDATRNLAQRVRTLQSESALVGGDTVRAAPAVSVVSVTVVRRDAGPPLVRHSHKPRRSH